RLGVARRDPEGKTGGATLPGDRGRLDLSQRADLSRAGPAGGDNERGPVPPPGERAAAPPGRRGRAGASAGGRRGSGEAGPSPGAASGGAVHRVEGNRDHAEALSAAGRRLAALPLSE